jgi:hypothetical protein
MIPEILAPTEALAVRFNGKWHPTDKGHLAHDLVLYHNVLKNSEKGSKALFSMSEEMKQQYKKKEEDLCRQLKLPKTQIAREKKIQEFEDRLNEAGLPFSVNIE